MKLYKYLLIFFVTMLFLSLAGCRDHTVQSVDVVWPDLAVEQRGPRMGQTPIVPPEKEGQLIKIDERYQTPRYRFEYGKDFSAPSSELALQFHYTASAELQARIHFENKDSRSAILPPTGGSSGVVIVPLGSKLPQEFFIEQKDPQGMQPQAASRVLQLEKLVFHPVGPSLEDTNGMEISVPNPDHPTPLHQYRYRLDYRYRRQFVTAAASGTHNEDGSPEAADEVVALRVSAQGRSASFRLFAKEGRHSIYFYSKDLDFAPSAVTVETGLPGFRLQQISFQKVPMWAEDSPPPIPADMGTVLRYDQNAWRRSDWELFSWNLFPSILVFDFRDYDIQAAFLKRLAFFVEKKGSTGKLLPNHIIEPLHGWNAHDYRAQDLAAFFQKARAENFPLNPEELLLRRILIVQGVILEEDGNFLPGDGGFISVSRQSSERLRYIFVTHEGYHGLYFASLEYRQAVQRVWEALSDDERRFWELFLDWKWYNTKDPYLLENEFQAYLMQQHRSYVDTYFKDYIIPRFVDLYPEYEQKADYFLDTYPEHFSRSAKLIEEEAQSLVGISAGDLVCIRESENKTARK